MLHLRSLNRFILTGLALLGLSVAPVNAAIYNYYYTGQTYDLTATGPYTSDMTITAVLSFDLATNINLSQADRSADLVAFSVFDGVRAVDETTGSFSNATFATDALGELTYWEMTLFADGGGFAGFRSWTSCYSYAGSGVATEACSANPGRFSSTPPAVVPVPAAAWLFGTALVGFVGMSRRRKIAR